MAEWAVEALGIVAAVFVAASLVSRGGSGMLCASRSRACQPRREGATERR